MKPEHAQESELGEFIEIIAGGSFRPCDLEGLIWEILDMQKSGAPVIPVFHAGGNLYQAIDNSNVRLRAAAALGVIPILDIRGHDWDPGDFEYKNVIVFRKGVVKND